MERFTEWVGGHGSGLPGKDCYTRLAQYEDIGKTPEEISKDLDKIYKLVEWLECHNKNYTKQQYYNILDILYILEGNENI